MKSRKQSNLMKKLKRDEKAFLKKFIAITKASGTPITPDLIHAAKLVYWGALPTLPPS